MHRRQHDLERQIVSRMMPRALFWAHGNCDVTPERGENRGRAVCVGGPRLLGMSEELGLGWDIYWEFWHFG